MSSSNAIFYGSHGAYIDNEHSMIKTLKSIEMKKMAQGPIPNVQMKDKRAPMAKIAH